MAASTLVTIRERPDLVPVIAGWLWDAFWQHRPREEIEALVAAPSAPRGPPQCFVQLEGGVPVGTASLVANDLDERPELTPWLAGVFVVPEARGRGLVRDLIAAVETAARHADIRTLWLYTRTAQRVYARAGWTVAEDIVHRGKAYALMRRDLR